MIIINELKLNPETFDNYIIPDEEGVLKNFANINIFIGPNNSGKSRFLRKIFSSRTRQYCSENLNEAIEKSIDSFISEAKKIQDEGFHGIFRSETVISDLNRFQIDRFISLNKNYFGSLDTINKKNIGSLKSALTMLERRQSNERIIAFRTKIDALLIKTDEIHQLIADGLELINADNLYIPTLRGLRPIQLTNNTDDFSNGVDNYAKRSVKDYFNNESGSVSQIFSGLNLYEEAKRLLLGNTIQRNNIRDFEKFLSESFFEGQEVNIVPSINDDVVHLLIGNEEYPIHHLGDGIQSLIILTYPLFFNKEKKGLVFIEEPEIFLHPGHQRLFIETISNKQFRNFQFFLTTHSNHFLDLTLDFDSISVFTFSKKVGLTGTNKFSIENICSSDNRILELIGVRKSSVFLSNCTIWVEGITDRIYIRKYLEVYQKSINEYVKEDYHYSFVEYGGGNITHWSFLENDDENHKNINVERLCSKLFLITDKDGEEAKPTGLKSKKQKRIESLKKNLGKRYYCLEAREIENTLSPSILINTIKHFEGHDCNQIDFTKIEKKDFQKVYLGKFIETNIKGIERKYAADSGTIKNKLEFSKIATNKIKNVDDLSAEGKALAKRLLEFIKANNA